MSYTASFESVVAAAAWAWEPPPRLSLSEWADREFVLSAESAAEPGRWRTIPYQRAVMDCFTDPAVEQVSVMKSARIGWTKIVNALIGYCIAQDPCTMMVVQPTIEDAEGYSKEEIAPMIRDVPAVAAVIPETHTHDAGQTLLHKQFPGGSLSMVGANSARGFRRVSRKIVLFDETDGYPPSAGTEGDQIKLGIRRTEYYWDRKIGAGSTPTIAGASRIEAMFEQGDQRRYFVPCPQCGHMAPLVFRAPRDDNEGATGHYMKWPDGEPEKAFFVCQKNGCIIEHKDKRGMVERGEWRAAKPFQRHASFHIWAAYSYSPNATWGHIAAEFIEANEAGSEQLKTFVNTVLGETWHEKGEAPDFQRLYDRREHYPRAVVPRGAVALTAGVDVQRDRLIWEVVAWGPDRQSWSVDIGVEPGDPAGDEVWLKIDELLEREWSTEDGDPMRVSMLAVDSGDNTGAVYNWARQKPLNRVIATKGVSTARTLIGAPTPVDVNFRGKRIARGYKVWPVGVDIAKGEFYGWLRQRMPETEKGETYAPGFCHFPEYGLDYFRQITAEHLVKIVTKKGFARYEWQVLPGRENHWLDCRVLARAAAALIGLDRTAAAKSKSGPAVAAVREHAVEVLTEAAQAAERQHQAAVTSESHSQPAPRRGTWLRGSRGAIGRGGSWIRR